ncbi:ly6/PLAUR domain-containing protein 6 isoform X4 [Equus caballus]|uniref:ly6/PLAUR domain-containing protein 6 isoform X4 n=1 Tax=Equus caballus TaxID=9796 RepID=UPI0004BD64B4|nr:PREDICTED: ly6/PLAUR domain-containing protein 6 isoform X2 [Equus przewalskii]XP_023478633.1 ly6/PLAUR domain-containing protein 6 isoform X2 [Equus caballus]
MGQRAAAGGRNPRAARNPDENPVLFLFCVKVSHGFSKAPGFWQNSLRFEFSLVVLSPRFWAPCMSDMESGPALAWLLLLSLLADCLKATQSRDFTVKDIIYLHPSTTPYPGGFKCFTCEKAADNYECNRWAPDIYCPRETRYCYTQHTMEVTGNSISVTKRCVPLEDCLSTGCRDSEREGHKVWATKQVTGLHFLL